MEKEVITNFTSGMLIIPREIQATLGLSEGAQIALRVIDGELIIHPISRPQKDVNEILAALEQTRDIFAGGPSPSDEVNQAQSEDEEHERFKLNGNLSSQSSPEDDLDALAGSLPALRGAVEELSRERSQHRW